MQTFTCSLSEPLEHRLAREHLQDAPTAPTGKKRLKKMLQMLPDGQRELVERHFLEGETVEDIAEAYGISRRAVYLKLRRATLHLQKIAGFMTAPTASLCEGAVCEAD